MPQALDVFTFEHGHADRFIPSGKETGGQSTFEKLKGFTRTLAEMATGRMWVAND